MDNNNNFCIFIFIMNSWIFINIYLSCAVYFQLFSLYFCCLNLLKQFLFHSCCIFAVSFFRFSLFNDTCTHKQSDNYSDLSSNKWIQFFSIIDNLNYYYYYYFIFHFLAPDLAVYKHIYIFYDLFKININSLLNKSEWMSVEDLWKKLKGKEEGGNRQFKK